MVLFRFFSQSGVLEPPFEPIRGSLPILRPESKGPLVGEGVGIFGLHSCAHQGGCTGVRRGGQQPVHAPSTHSPPSPARNPPKPCSPPRAGNQPCAQPLDCPHTKGDRINIQHLCRIHQHTHCEPKSLPLRIQLSREQGCKSNPPSLQFPKTVPLNVGANAAL